MCLKEVSIIIMFELRDRWYFICILSSRCL